MENNLDNYLELLKYDYEKHIEENKNYKRPANCVNLCKFSGSSNCCIVKYCTKYEEKEWFCEYLD